MGLRGTQVEDLVVKRLAEVLWTTKEWIQRGALKVSLAHHRLMYTVRLSKSAHSQHHVVLEQKSETWNWMLLD